MLGQHCLPSQGQGTDTSQVIHPKFFLGVSDSLAKIISESKTVSKEWFGNGHYVPVKDDPQQASKFYEVAKGCMPDYILAFEIPVNSYISWIHNSNMTRVGYIYGYRIFMDVNLQEMCLGDWKLHPVKLDSTMAEGIGVSAD